jgi:hypothetical protein
VSKKSFPDCKHLLQQNYMEYFFFSKRNSTQEVFLQHIRIMVKKYVCIPRSFLVINVCIQGKTLCSPCSFDPFYGTSSDL